MKNLYFKTIFKNETQDTRCIILIFLGNTSEGLVREGWGSSTDTRYTRKLHKKPLLKQVFSLKNNDSESFV